jgi:PEP-CTERM motif
MTHLLGRGISASFGSVPGCRAVSRNELQKVFAIRGNTKDRKGTTHMNRLTTLFATVAMVLFAAAAQADTIRTWGYTVDRDRPAVEADMPSTGGITLTNELFREAAGDSDVVLTSLSTFSSAAFETPDTFSAKPYSLTLTITDLESGQTGSLTFSGVFNGILSRAYAQIATEFTSLTEQSLKLGKNTYSVVLNSYVAPPNPGASNTGSIGARVMVFGDDVGEPPPPPPPPPPVDTPEPSSIILAGLGLSFLGFSSVRKWRRKA